MFDLVYPFHQITPQRENVARTVFCTPTGLYEWLVMLQRTSASPGSVVKVIIEGIKGLEQVEAHLSTM